MLVELPWPPSSLSGHNDGNRWEKAPIVAKHRAWAKAATKAATQAVGPMEIQGTGDIRVCVTFYPPNRRGDRINFPNRMKPYFDGIADALKVNDSRFLPSYQFAEPVRDGKVVVAVSI